MAEEHADAVQRVVLGGDDVGLADAVPVERGVEDRLQKVAVGQVVGPLALALETGRQRIVAQRFLAVAQLGQPRVAHHHIAHHQRHLDGVLPGRFLLLRRVLHVRRIIILALDQVGIGPSQCFLELVGVVDVAVDAARHFGHVHGFNAHPQRALEQRLIDDGAGDAHGGTADG